MKPSVLYRSILFITYLLIAACASTQQPHSEKMGTIECPELRPEMCTMDYNPVCGYLSDGTFKTSSNGCNACTDPEVVSYSEGECK